MLHYIEKLSNGNQEKICWSSTLYTPTSRLIRHEIKPLTQTVNKAGLKVRFELTVKVMQSKWHPYGFYNASKSNTLPLFGPILSLDSLVQSGSVPAVSESKAKRSCQSNAIWYLQSICTCTHLSLFISSMHGCFV